MRLLGHPEDGQPNFPIRLLVHVVKLKKVLDLKRKYVKQITDMNTTAEKINLHSAKMDEDFQVCLNSADSIYKTRGDIFLEFRVYEYSELTFCQLDYSKNMRKCCWTLKWWTRHWKTICSTSMNCSRDSGRSWMQTLIMRKLTFIQIVNWKHFLVFYNYFCLAI